MINIQKHLENQNSIGTTTDTVLDLIKIEREYQKELYDNGMDAKHTPSEWLCLVNYYLFGFGRKKVTSSMFKQSLIKSAAIIVAAIENIKNMESNNWFDND